MAKDDSSPFRLHRSTHLPTEADFDPFGGGLDAQCAWGYFGGNSIRNAFKLFRSKPYIHCEDFMFMGPKAFDYYFPVLDRYVCESLGVEDEEDDVAYVGAAIETQMDIGGAKLPSTLIEEIAQLSRDVGLHYRRYLPPSKSHRRILRAWEAVDVKVAEARS